MRCGRVALGAVLVAVLGSSIAPAALAQAAAEAGPSATAEVEAGFSAEQLEQIAAPIALYPDALVMQILMGSTYPLEIVEADRWVKANTSLSGKALEEALKQRDWDPAVKALCGFPTVLASMNENLDWTRDLGDAVLAQKPELLDAVQRMRGKAYEAGNLKTSEQQVVTQQPDKIIVIESKSPEVIYVPTYSPVVVYGPSWHYPSYYYPAMYVPPPPGYGLMMFGAGMAWGAALSGGCNWGWGHSDIKVNVDNEYNFNRNTNINAKKSDYNQGSWNHNAEHRKGVNYKDSQTAQKYGAKGGANRVTQDQARGYDRAGAQGARPTREAGGQRPGASPSTRDRAGAQPSAGKRDLGGQRPTADAATSRAGAGRESAGKRDVGGGQRASAGKTPSRAGGGGGSAWSGSRSPSFDRASSGRGASSRSGGGGGGRGGGGGGRGR